MAEVICAECGAPMVLRETHKYRWKNGQPRKFYGCSRFPICSGIHGAHPNGQPVGIPGNKEVKLWRIQAHAAFDLLWASGLMPRKAAYQWMQQAMEMTKDEAHIGRFTIEQSQRLMALVEKRISIGKIP